MPKNNLETKENVKIWSCSPSSDLLSRFSFGLLKISRIILADFRAVIKSVEIWLKREIEWLDWRQEKRGEIDRNFQRFTLRHFYIPQGRGDQKQHRRDETFTVQLTNITRQSMLDFLWVCGRRIGIESQKQNEHDKIVIHRARFLLDSKYVNSIFIVVPHFWIFSDICWLHCNILEKRYWKYFNIY